jgi:hypothetical protein
MNDAWFSTFAALAGTIVGALGTFTSTWLTQIVQGHQARRAAEIARRQEVYGRFLDELAQVIGLAMAATAVDYPKLAGLFALKGRICLFGSPEVVKVVEGATLYAFELYTAPPATPDAVREAMEKGRQDWIREFARVARADLDAVQAGRVASRH